MSLQPPPGVPAPDSPRPRPLAELDLEPVVADGERAARRWAAALMLARPLETLEEFPLAEIASSGPALCEQVVRALGSEAELDRLLTLQGSAAAAEAPGGPVSLAALGLAADAAGLVTAVEVLRGALWELLVEHLGLGGPAARARAMAELSDRLAGVCAALAAAALSAAPAAPAARSRTTAAAGGVSIVDEGGPAGAAPPAGGDGDASPPRAAEIEIRDFRADGPNAWVGSIGRELERFAHDRRPFAVVLLEVAAAGDGEWPRAALEQALAAALTGGAGSLTRERAGRYWVVLPGADRAAAQAAAARLEHAAAANVRRSAVTVATGTAVCPEDGEQAAALAAHADVGLYAARREARRAPGAADGTR